MVVNACVMLVVDVCDGGGGMCGGGECICVMVVVDVVCYMCALEAFFKCLQVPREALEIAETSINFRSGKFGYSICSFFSKGHAEIFREFWHDFAKKRDIWGIATNAWAGVS